MIQLLLTIVLCQVLVVACTQTKLWLTMKIDRHVRAKILTQAEIQLLFSSGLENNRDPPSGRASLRALFGICLYTACRINEACTIRTVDVYDTLGRVRPELTIRKGNTND